ncbi:MAG: BMC domain-containing protein [Planctomycetes bacterium]|nr:BMC domain-containing protein [Planctomycetota bacterium]MBI3847295.1 BMC domain-containing protein [Planctomycetota bacterium]
MIHDSSKPTLALLEFSSIARGIEATDALLKTARVTVLRSKPISSGKYITLFSGDVEDVRSSLMRGREVGGASVVDELLLPSAHPGILPAASGKATFKLLDAVGIIETQTVASTIVAADAAAKTGAVHLIALRLGDGIGGRAFATFTGEVSDVRVAVEAGAALAQAKGYLKERVVIAKAHPDLAQILDARD